MRNIHELIKRSFNEGASVDNGVCLSPASKKSIKMETIDYATYIRKLPFSVVSGLSSMMDPMDTWKKFAARIPNTMRRSGCLYEMDQMKQFEKVGLIPNGSSTREVLRDWGTRNPTVRDLVGILKQVDLIRPADYLEHLIDSSKRNPASSRILYSREQGAESSGDQSMGDLTISSDKKQTQPNRHVVDQHILTAGETSSATLPDITTSGVHDYPYSTLCQVTDNFSERNILGRGGFSSVYLGNQNGVKIAVKRLFISADPNETRQFKTETDVLTTFKHKNLLPIVGLSTDGQHFCIVYEYMENGSLEDRLQCKGNSSPLPWRMRIDIAKGTAEGINYLHTSQKKPLIHRDIKTANILLDGTFTPKLGDFGLARQGPSDKTSFMTSTIIGTSAYMAPESMSSKISAKNDSFSYGVVLLELLTGLPPFDGDRDESALTSHVEESFDWEVTKILDKSAGEWDDILAQKLMNLAKRCTAHRRSQRCTIAEVMEEIRSL